ncbi:hypothetical protein FHG87_009796 [Trinorchestia longiramus]|nr:hypothetical protein FHG87_009796 [Trinorchestia longiramus]
MSSSPSAWSGVCSSRNTRVRATEVKTVMKLEPVTTGNTTSTNERSRSCNKAQPTAQYKEAATLCFTDSLSTKGFQSRHH